MKQIRIKWPKKDKIITLRITSKDYYFIKTLCKESGGIFENPTKFCRGAMIRLLREKIPYYGKPEYHGELVEYP